MQLNGPGEYNFFQVPPLIDKIHYTMCVGHSTYVLFNDRAGIQFLRYIVARGPDDLYAPPKCGMIGLGARKGGKERMMDVDDFIGITINYARGYYLHIPGQHDKVDPVFPQKGQLLAFGGRPVFLGYGNMEKRNVKLLGNILQIRMIAQDERNIYRQFPRIEPA